MIKKVVWGLLALGLVGILIAGAVVRTSAKTGESVEARGLGRGDSTGSTQAEVDEWLTIEGSVVSADANGLLVQADTGEEIVIENRPWTYAQEQGFVAQPGDQVKLTAFYEEGAVEVGTISDSTNGQTVRLRDESGRPMWAGHGRRNG